MNTYRSLATGHQLLSLALAALITAGVVGSLDAQATGRHADAAQMAQTQQAPCQQACLPAARPARS